MKIFIFGTGLFYQRNKCNEDLADKEIVGFIDNDKNKQGTIFEGKKIISPDEIETFHFDKIFIMSMNYKEIKQQLIGLNISEEKVVIYTDARTKLKRILSYSYLKGNGIEIGALNNQMRVNPKTCYVKYIDNKNCEELHKTYKHIGIEELVPVDILDDGETLESINSCSLDFIIASHFLEHCRNPIKTIKMHLAKIKEDGILFYVVPDKRFTFDKKRKLTDWEHIYSDYQKLPDQFQHYYEFASLSFDEEDKIMQLAQTLIETSYSIHFHIWDSNTLLDFFIKVRELFNQSFDIMFYNFFYDEIICILKKN